MQPEKQVNEKQEDTQERYFSCFLFFIQLLFEQ